MKKIDYKNLKIILNSFCGDLSKHSIGYKNNNFYSTNGHIGIRINDKLVDLSSFKNNPQSEFEIPKYNLDDIIGKVLMYHSYNKISPINIDYSELLKSMSLIYLSNNKTQCAKIIDSIEKYFGIKYLKIISKTMKILDFNWKYFTGEANKASLLASRGINILIAPLNTFNLKLYSSTTNTIVKL
jgi:hypothetical protein